MENKLKKSLPEDKIYVAFDGDDAGSQVERAALQNDTDAISDISNRIINGSKAVIAYARKYIDPDLRIIIHGGDDIGLLMSDKVTPGDIDEIRHVYHETAGFTITAGIGKTIPQATRALLSGKVTGKNKTVVWSDKAESIIDQLTRETPEDKARSMLSKSRYAKRKTDKYVMRKSKPFDPRIGVGAGVGISSTTARQENANLENDNLRKSDSEEFPTGFIVKKKSDPRTENYDNDVTLSSDNALPHLKDHPDSEILNGVNINDNITNDAIDPFHRGVSPKDVLKGLGSNIITKPPIAAFRDIHSHPVSDFNDPNFTSSHREPAYKHAAEEYFGMHGFIPRTTAFNHPGDGEEGEVHSAMEMIPGAEHIEPAHLQDSLKKWRENGDLFKLGAMNMVLGNHDRHGENIMTSGRSLTGAPENLHLIDHGASFDYDHVVTNTDPRYTDHIKDVDVPSHVHEWIGNYLSSPHELSDLLGNHGAPDSVKNTALNRASILKAWSSEAQKNNKLNNLNILFRSLRKATNSKGYIPSYQMKKMIGDSFREAKADKEADEFHRQLMEGVDESTAEVPQDKNSAYPEGTESTWNKNFSKF